MHTLHVLGCAIIGATLVPSASAAPELPSQPLAARVIVKSVTFAGTGRTDVTIDCSSGWCNNYPTPHWLDANADGDALDPEDNLAPVAYTRGSRPAVTDLVFTVQPADLTVPNVEVVGVGPHGETYWGIGNVTNGELIVPGTLEADQPLPNVVDCYDPYSIEWTVSKAGYGSRDAGISSNTMYVTYAQPIGSRLESYFDISTRAAAGSSDEQQTIDLIWDDFADLEVYNAHGERLAYYRGVLCSYDCRYYSAAQLVYYTTSQCGGWADLMIQCLRTQGIGTAQFITIEPQAGPDPPRDCRNAYAGGIVVKNYGISSAYILGSQCKTYPFRFNDPCALNTPWASVDVQDEPGLPGQDNANPASWFRRHFIVKVNFAYYDPAYGGGPFEGTREEANLLWEQGAMWGYWGYADSALHVGVRRDHYDIRETGFDR
ncbi:MAG: hypothetical protein D8M59_01965 [Planctomycetes bacterium]|nr:hypothetical protein [Planctomycetota bacterium]